MKSFHFAQNVIARQCLLISIESSVTRLGDFLKIFAINFRSKVAQNVVTFGSILKDITFKHESPRLLFGQLLRKG